jgi:phage terminase Nu1 subunit (DNA packaging protein)
MSRSNVSPAPSAEYLTTRQLAERMGMSVSTIQKLSEREDCPVVKSEFVRKNLFHYETFLEWFCNGRREANGARGKHRKFLNTQSDKEVNHA